MERPASFWEGRGPVRHHLLWHEALFIDEAGHFNSAPDYFDRGLAPQELPGYLEMTDCASFQLRLEAAGVDCGGRWADLAEAGRYMVGDRILTFNDLHTLFVLAMAEDGAGLRRPSASASLAGYAKAKGSFDAEAAAGRIAAVVRSPGRTNGRRS